MLEQTSNLRLDMTTKANSQVFESHEKPQDKLIYNESISDSVSESTTQDLASHRSYTSASSCYSSNYSPTPPKKQDDPNEVSFAPNSSTRLPQTETDSPSSKITIKKPIKDAKISEKRQKKIIDLIDSKLGPSSSIVHRYDLSKLEQQALTFLKLEDEQADQNGTSYFTKHTFFLTIIAACCYIQTKQSEKWQIPMKDFVRVSKSVGLSRTTSAIDLCEKWAGASSALAQSSKKSEQEPEQKQEQSLMNYDNRPRESQEMRSDSIKQRVQEQHAKMLKWYKIQATFLQSVVDKGVGNFI